MRHLGLLGVILCSVLATAQTAVDIAADPHYHLLLQNNQVRVFALKLAPTEQAYVRHEHNFLVVTLQDCEVVIWSEGQSPIENFRFSQGNVSFFLGGQTAGIRNDRSTEYRNITVEFLNPKVTMSLGYQAGTGQWAYGGGLISPPTDPHVKFMNGIDLGAAVAKDVQLLAGDSFPAPEKPAAELLIPITDVDLRIQGDLHIRKSNGQAFWIGDGRKSALANASNDPTRFAIVQLWTQPAD